MCKTQKSQLIKDKYIYNRILKNHYIYIYVCVYMCIYSETTKNLSGHSIWGDNDSAAPKLVVYMGDVSSPTSDLIWFIILAVSR